MKAAAVCTLNSLPSCSLIVVDMHRAVTGRPFASQLWMASRSMAKNSVTRALLKLFQSHHSAACVPPPPGKRMGGSGGKEVAFEGWRWGGETERRCTHRCTHMRTHTRTHTHTRMRMWWMNSDNMTCRCTHTTTHPHTQARACGGANRDRGGVGAPGVAAQSSNAPAHRAGGDRWGHRRGWQAATRCRRTSRSPCPTPCSAPPRSRAAARASRGTCPSCAASARRESRARSRGSTRRMRGGTPPRPATRGSRRWTPPPRPGCRCQRRRRAT